MKKNIIIFIIIIVIIICVVNGLRYISNRVNMNCVNYGVTTFIYEENDYIHELNDEDVEIIKTIFNGKKLSADNLSCGFSEDVSIILNNEMTLCIAQDTCPIVFWKEKNKYIRLSESEKMQLYDILKPYGFYFPCV